MNASWLETVKYARYIDEARQNIEVLYTVDDPSHPKGRVLKTFVILANEKSDPRFQELLEKYSYDQIMEMTYVYNADAKKMHEQQVYAIAKKNGILASINVEDMINEDFINRFVQLFFDKGLPENEAKELLFKTKLQLFELDKVRDCKDRKIKSKLRKAKTLLEVFSAMAELEEAINS